MRAAHVTSRPLPVLLTGSRAPVWWAVILLIVIESTVFATLLTSYAYLRISANAWPPEGIPLPALRLPVLNTFVLLMSSIAVYWAGTAIGQGDTRKLKLGLAAGIMLEIAFLTVKLIESGGYAFDWSTNAYASIFLGITNLHSVHVVAAIVMASATLILAFRGYFTPERRLGIQVVSYYWQFVAVIWVPVFVVLYLVPRLA